MRKSICVKGKFFSIFSKCESTNTAETRNRTQEEDEEYDDDDDDDDEADEEEDRRDSTATFLNDSISCTGGAKQIQILTWCVWV